MKHDVKGIAARFAIDGEFIEAAPYGNGHINDTYASRFNTGTGEKRFIHQRINQNVFKQPDKLMENVERVVNHVSKQVMAEGGDPVRNCLTLVPTVDGSAYYHSPEGDFWRTYIFIEGAQSKEMAASLAQATEGGRAFAVFQSHLSSLSSPRLHDTIPNFHNTPSRFERFTQVLASPQQGRASMAKVEIDFALGMEKEVSRIMDSMAQGRMPERICHNDTKFNNLLIDDVTGLPVCVIDLDTVMPGSVLFDFGDLIRMGAASAAEDEKDLSKVRFDIDKFAAFVRGYLEGGKAFLVDEEINLLAFSAKLITFEIGLRFLTDFLEGDVYFKVHREGHNLDRTRTQFKMAADMASRMDEMEEIVRKARVS